MDPRRLFLRRCDQVAALMESNDEGDLLDLAGRLRQLLFDGSVPLVDKVNSNRLRLKFKVETSHVPEGFEAFVISDGPGEFSPFKTHILELSRDRFIKFPMLYVRPDWLTVHDIVMFAANVAGGVHHDSEPKDRFKPIDAISKQLFLGGMPSGLIQMRPIAHITMSGLLPLIEDVRNRGDGR